MCLRSVPISTQSEPGLIVSATVASGLSAREVGRSRPLQVGPSFTVPESGLECAENEPDERRLARPVGPMSPIGRRHDPRGQIANDRAIAGSFC